MSTCLVTGGTGQVGGALVASALGEVIAPTHSACDVNDRNSVDAVIQQERPQWVIHAAAWTDVDGCEQHPERAWGVNTEGTANVARACRRVGARMLYVSTDYVFDGEGQRPYRPDDAPRPVSVYGRTKLAGELAVQAILPHDHLVVRTSWIFAPHGKNFVRTILRLAATRPELTVVDDQIGRPTYAPDLAIVLWSLVQHDARGTFHACNAGSCTWFAFARAILARAGIRRRVVPIRSEALGRPAPRPRYSVLEDQETTQVSGVQTRGWEDALDEMLT